MGPIVLFFIIGNPPKNNRGNYLGFYGRDAEFELAGLRFGNLRLSGFESGVCRSVVSAARIKKSSRLYVTSLNSDGDALLTTACDEAAREKKTNPKGNNHSLKP